MDIKEIKHLAELSKLEFSDEELVQFSSDFESLVELVDKVKNSSITGTKSLCAINMQELREDRALPSTNVDVLLQNSPIVKDDSIVVPRIME